MLPVRKVLSRLRCINDSTTKLLCKEPLPESLCYAPSYARYEVNASNLPNPLKFPRKYSIYESKSTSSTVVAEIDILENCLLNFNSKELHYKDGVWMYLVEFSHPSSESKLGNFRPGWIFISNNRFSHHDLPLVKVKPAGNRVLNSWLEVVEYEYGGKLHSSLKSSAIDQHYLTFRWPVSFDQWWECKFIAEGMIDQGGGFRESLSDLSEELCPPDPSNPVPLPFFVRSPNQQQNDNNVFRDCFVPSPACKDLVKYEFIGKLMGACFRGREQLALDLAPWVWRKLVGQKTSWSDFATVDAAEVKAMQAVEHADRETFEQLGRTWSCVASDGKLVELRPEGSKTPVSFEERLAFVEQVKLKRMTEDDEQLSALRRGLLQTVPAAVLALMEWSEVERKICGIAEVTTEELKKHVRIGSFSPGDSRVQCLWEVLNGFTNEERSRFLRFVTGRRRLPVMIYVEPATDEGADGFPTSSTCCNLLFLPRYSTAKKAEEKIRYAIQNCVAIDTDINDI